MGLGRKTTKEPHTMAAESGESDGGDADAGKDGSSTKHHKNKDPLASPVAKLFRKHSHACRHTSAKVHRVFGQPVLHPRFEGDVDTVELATRHLTKECQCVGPPSNLERRAVATLSGMSTTEVDERVPRIICPECQHDLAFHREGTDAEKHNTRILAHFRPTLLAQCTTDAQPILPPSRSLESLALLLNGTASIYPGKKSKPSKASSWLPRIFGKRSKGKAGDDAPVCIHVDDDDDGGKNDGDHGDGSNSTITTTANGGGNQSRGEHNKQAKQAESSAEKRGAQQRKRASKDVEAVDATDSSGEGESAVLETPKKRPKHSFLGLKEFFIPAPKSKPTPPPTPPHPFQDVFRALDKNSSASRPPAIKLDHVDSVSMTDDGTAVCRCKHKPHAVVLQLSKSHPLTGVQDEVVMADICTVAAGSCYGVVVLTTAADILTFRAKTTKSGLVIEQQHSTKLPHTLASPASVSLTPDVLALGTWEHGLWVWQAPFEKKQKKELHGQQLLGDGWEVHAVTSIAPSCVLCCGSDLRVHCFNIGDTAGGSKSSVVHEAAISTITHDAAHNTVISSGLDGLLCVWRLTTSRPRPGGSSNADTPLFAISGPPLLAVEITGRLPIISHCHVGRFLLLVQREDSSHMVSAIELPAAATTTAETQHCTSTSDDTKRATSTMADEGGRASMSLAATTWVLRHVPVQQDVHVFEEPLLQDADGDPSNLDSTAPDESTA